MALPQFVSQKFRFWSFVSMALLVFVHGYNLNIRYMEPGTIPGEPMTLTSFTEYFIANGILRFRIPMLFIISGYLYALRDEVPNKQRMPRRLKTLLAPYLIWSAVGLLMTFALEAVPYTRDLVAGSHIAQIDQTRTIVHEYHWYEVLIRWIFFPVPYQLWFIRVLLIYNAAYPLLRKWVTHRRSWIFFSLAALMWLGTINLLLIEGEGLLFFSLGIWLQKTNFNIEKSPARFNPAVWGVIFVLLAAIKTWLAFAGQSMIGDAVVPIITFMHKVVVLSGLIACWYGLDRVAAWAMGRTWFVWLSAFSFFIYALHAPLVAYLIDGGFALFHSFPAYRMITFVVLPLSVTVLCVGVGALVRLISPKVYSTLTGGRGI